MEYFGISYNRISIKARIIPILTLTSGNAKNTQLSSILSACIKIIFNDSDLVKLCQSAENQKTGRMKIALYNRLSF